MSAEFRHARGRNFNLSEHDFLQRFSAAKFGG
jgi:hypothetical protein